MAFTVSVDFKKEFDINASFDKVFDVLVDVKESFSHFPKVDNLVDLGDMVFRTEMEKVGIDKYSIHTVYSCKYENNRNEGRIWWNPVDDENETAKISGEWKITAKDDNTTHVEFSTKGDMNIPLTSLVKIFLSPLVKREFEGMVDKHHNNLRDYFNKS